MKCPIIFLAVLLLSVSLTAHATNGGHPPPQPSPVQQSSNVSQHSQTKSSANSRSKSESSSNAASRSTSSSGSNSYSSGGRSQASLQSSGNSNTTVELTSQIAPVQDARTSASLHNSGNSAATVGGLTATAGSADAQASNGDQEVTIHGDTTNYEAPKIPVSTAIAGGTNTTAACRYSVGAGGQATILGLSLGFGRKDRDCERVALADMMYERGNPEAGDVIMCRVKELREAFGADCLAMLRRARPIVPTQHQLQQREEYERGEYRK